jgi:transcriptional regulator with XRE-family HTH domain
LQVAGQVREIRRARHLSQRQLAGRMQVPRTYISKIENGKAIPTLGSLERLADALEVNVCQLVRDSRSRREEEVNAILSDPFLAELAALLPQLDPLHPVLRLAARHGHRPPPHRLEFARKSATRASRARSVRLAWTFCCGSLALACSWRAAAAFARFGRMC